MSRLPYVKIALALFLLAAACLAMVRVRAFHAAAPTCDLTSHSENAIGALVPIINVDGMIPLAVKEFENVVAMLSAERNEVRQERSNRIHPYAGTIFDDPSCQQFQEFEPLDMRRPWLAPDDSTPLVGGYLLAF